MVQELTVDSHWDVHIELQVIHIEIHTECQIIHTEVLTSHWVASHWVASDCGSDKLRDYHWNGGWYSLACAMICSRMCWLNLSNAWKGCRGLFWEIISQAFFMLLLVQFGLGLPTLRCSGSRGIADVVVKATWCWGCCRSRRSTCPSNFIFLFSHTSVSGLIFLSGPIVGADTASLAF